jgi:tetratricopeptide (TPR) repeat protein
MEAEPLPEISLEERQLFAERIDRSLDERPLGLSPDAHRRAVAALIERLGTVSHYELLGVAPGASGGEVHAGYERLARLVHPRHAGALGIPGRQGVLELLLERATQAYLILSHPGRRKDYDRSLDARPWNAGTWGVERQDETRQVARRYFERAELLAAQEQLHQAIELLREAVRIDARPEYHALLGQLEAKNPHWLRRAEGNLARALELGSRDPALAPALAKVRELLEGEATTAAGDGPVSPGAAKAAPRRKLPFRRR